MTFGTFRLLSIHFVYIIYIYKKVSQSGLTTKNEKWHCKGSIDKQRNLRTDVFKYKYKRDFTKRKQVVPNVIKKKKKIPKEKKSQVWSTFNKNQASEKWLKRLPSHTLNKHLLTENVSSFILKLRPFSF